MSHGYHVQGRGEVVRSLCSDVDRATLVVVDFGLGVAYSKLVDDES